MLEAALERGIFFNVFLVLVKRGGADTAQFAARQRRLQHVRGINRAFGGTGPDQRVQLIDKKDNLPLRVLNFFQHCLEPVFKLTAILRASQHRSEVESHESLVPQRLGDVAGNDPLCQALDNRGFADARFTDQYRIIFRAPGEDLNGPSYFIVATDHRIQFALARQLGKVARVF